MSTTSFDQIRAQIGEWLTGPNGHSLWDLMTGLRGPDSPSETPSMPEEERDKAYRGRRERKRRTVEVIRGHAFGGIVGGSARYRKDIDFVSLPPRSTWDHFDRHVEKTARVLGLGVKVEAEDVKSTGEKVEVDMTPEHNPIFTVMHDKNAGPVLVEWPNKANTKKAKKAMKNDDI